VAEDAILTLGLLLHHYYFDCFGFPLMCLHLLRHALYLLWMDFHPCLCIYTGFSLTNRMYALIVPYPQWGFDTQAVDNNRRFWKSDSIYYTDIQWSIPRIPNHCTYSTMNKKRLLQMQFNIKSTVVLQLHTEKLILFLVTSHQVHSDQFLEVCSWVLSLFYLHQKMMMMSFPSFFQSIPF
jgi:hypothetical protein